MINQQQFDGGSKPPPYSPLPLPTFADLRTAVRTVPTAFIKLKCLQKQAFL